MLYTAQTVVNIHIHEMLIMLMVCRCADT